MSKTKEYDAQAVLDLVAQHKEPLTLARLITAEVSADRWDEAMKVFQSAKSGTIH